MKKVIALSLFALMVIPYASAEIVKNAAGDKIELKANGTWVKVPSTAEDFVNDGQEYTLKLEDGNRQSIDVEVYPDVTLMGVVKPLKKEDIAFKIKTTSLSAQYKLKNKYSYKPKDVYVTQKGRDLKIRIAFTGDNSYGAAVASSYESSFYIEENGKLKQTSSMFD